MAHSDGKRSRGAQRGGHCRQRRTSDSICELAVCGNDRLSSPRVDRSRRFLLLFLTGMGFSDTTSGHRVQCRPQPAFLRSSPKRRRAFAGHHQFPDNPQFCGPVWHCHLHGYLGAGASRAGTAVRKHGAQETPDGNRGRPAACRPRPAQPHAAILDLEGNERRLFLSPRAHNWRRLRPGELGEPRGSQFAGVRCFRSRYRFSVGREPNLLRSGSAPAERHSVRRHVQRVESLPHPGNR